MSFRALVCRSFKAGILLSLLLTAGAAPARSSGTPSIVLKPHTLDFGTMKQNDARSLPVEIRNVAQLYYHNVRLDP